jgi:hypothetical protein
MKRITLLLLALLVAAQALAFPLQHRRKDTTTIVSGIPAVTVATGKITADGCDGATVTCQCAGINATTSLAACNSGSTAVAEAPNGTGHYELTIDSTDIDGEKCVYKIVCGAGILDHIIEVDTAEYLSYENITSMTATQPAVSWTGNTSGAGLRAIGGSSDGNGIEAAGDGTAPTAAAAGWYGLGGAGGGRGAFLAGGGGLPGFASFGQGAGAGGLISGGSTDGDGLVVTGDAVSAPAGTGSALVALAGSNGQGGWFQGAGTGSGIFGTGRAGMQLLAPSGAPVTTVAGALWARGTSGYHGGEFESTGASGIALNINNNAGGTAATGGQPALKVSGAAGAVGGPALGLYAGSNTGGAGGNALVLVGGESTWDNAGGKGGSAINAASGASHASATAWNPTILATNDKTDVLQLTCSGGTACDAAQLTGYGTGLALHIISGNGADGSLDRLLQRRDSTL